MANEPLYKSEEKLHKSEIGEQVSPKPNCYHVNLKRQLVGDFAWYKCLNCNQKFLPGKREEPLIPWDGKLRVTN